MSLKKSLLITWILIGIGLVFVLVGAAFSSKEDVSLTKSDIGMVFYIFGVVFCIAGSVFNAITYRCPHCGKYLNRARPGKHCMCCGGYLPKNDRDLGPQG
ncbi:MAG: hypothetical protein J6T47_04085 [Lachnospiraceae bacterium]|nr:hypothetical protein [Lachnospiraceae bacterium]